MLERQTPRQILAPGDDVLGFDENPAPSGFVPFSGRYAPDSLYGTGVYCTFHVRTKQVNFKIFEISPVPDLIESGNKPRCFLERISLRHRDLVVRVELLIHRTVKSTECPISTRCLYISG